VKQKVYLMTVESARDACHSEIDSHALDGSVEVVVRNARVSKTLAQLNSIFGVWLKYLSEVSGHSEADLHARLKQMFLARIYSIEPIGDYQEQWVDLLAFYQESGNTKKMLNHAARISLSWANIKQTTEYMKAVEQHYMGSDTPLPVLDSDRKYYK